MSPAFKESALNHKLGIESEDLPDGSVRLSMTTDESLHNEIGVVHGGMSATLLDGAMGRAVCRTLQEGQVCATVQLSLQFLAPAQGRVSALARVTKRARTIAFVEGEATRADGVIVARAQGTWAVR